MSIVALVGAQYGSEGKGAIASKIADDFDVHVRTGAPNAGHTFYFDGPLPEDGHESDLGPVTPIRIKHVARSIPCGWTNKNAHICIGAGGLIDVDLLIDEVHQIESYGVDLRSRLMVDSACGVIDPIRHHEFEGGVSGEAHALIGSTGEGVGPARMARIARGTFGHGQSWAKFYNVGSEEVADRLQQEGIKVVNNLSLTLNSWAMSGSSILLEGTQGSGLSLVHGPWPYCTSTDTNAAQLCVDSGLSPRHLASVLLVARTYPIRVAGNSGPMYKELDGFHVLGVEPETTTVTKKVRRIGEWDDVLFHKAAYMNGPGAGVALTFADYIDPAVAGCTEWDDLTTPIKRFIQSLEQLHEVRVIYVGTGPDSVCVHPKARWGR